MVPSTQYVQVLEPLEDDGGNPGTLTVQLRYRFVSRHEKTRQLDPARGGALQRCPCPGLCALRDPNRQIYRLFPKATSYRSIVRTVGKEARREVARACPSISTSMSLGGNTLYVPMRVTRPSVWSTFAARLAGGGWWRWPGGSTSISE